MILKSVVRHGAPGIGIILVKKLLESGYCVAATSRNAQSLKESVGVTMTSVFFRLLLIWITSLH
jgi:short-subunit dehydrogenase involved in D-alanine esterification of teichoic acids